MQIHIILTKRQRLGASKSIRCTVDGLQVPTRCTVDGLQVPVICTVDGLQVTEQTGVMQWQVPARCTDASL